MKHSIPIRSYVILGIYSLLVAAFYKWEASLFVLVASIMVEMALLFVGSFFVHSDENDDDSLAGRSGAAFAFLAGTALVYPMAFLMSVRYEEFDPEGVHGVWQPLFEFKWQILTMALCLGLGYLVDFKQLQQKKLKEYLSFEVYRLSFVLFGIALLGLVCLEGIREFSDTPYLPTMKEYTPYNSDNKMIPIIGMVCARMVIEIWYVRTVIRRSAS